MDRRRPFSSKPVGINLLQLPVIGSALGNPQQFLNNLRGLGMPQAQQQQNTSREQYGQDNRGERMRFSDNYYEREQMASHDHGPRTFQEPRDSRNLDRDDYYHEERGRIHGLMDKEILFPEIDPPRHSERYASKTNFQSSFDEDKGLKLENMYGKRDNTTIPWNAQLRPNCFLVPPLDDTNVLPLGDPQPGSCTIFVGGLPWLADEFIVREIFNVCGPIKTITFKNTRKTIHVKYCQVAFYKHDSVEKAVTFNGHVLVIGDGRDRKTKIGRIRVNYDQEATSNKKTNVDTQKPTQKEEEKDLESTFYNRKNAFQLLDLLRHDTSVVESLEVIAHWFEKGECNPYTVNVFHTVLSTIHSFVKRLIAKRKEHEQHVEKQKKQAIDKANEIKQQCEAVWKVFEAATKQKSWDHFTKGQRKTISQWHTLIRNEIKSAQEAEIQNREEVGMDLDDEVPNLGTLIEQPALQMAAEHQHEQDDSQSPPKAKKPRSDASESDAASTDALKLENAKLRTQVESLRGIAEQNTNLMWSMQSYQYQADLTRQQYSDSLKEKDSQILRLQQALQHIKENIKDKKLLTEIESATSDQSSELQILVDLSNDQTATNEVAVRHEESKENGGEETREQMGEDDDGIKVEQVTEDHNEVDEEKNGEQLCENQADIGVFSGQEDVSNKEESSLPSPTKQTVQFGDNFQCESVLSQEGNAKLAEMSIGESKAFETQVIEEEKVTEEGNAKLVEEEEQPAEEGEKQKKEEVRTVEGERTTAVDIPTEQEENPAEEEGEEEEGYGRFVQIDDEQFEVIDDMDEESEDDFKEVTNQSSLNEDVEQMNEQLASNGDYKEAAAHSPKKENVEQVDEPLPNEDDFKEVVARDPLNESADQASEQFPVDWSFYQQAYSAQYQTWPSYGMASYGSMDFGPNVVRLSGEELVLVGIICSYLQLCPSGATSGEIRDYLSRQFKERRKDVVEKLLSSLPVLFTTAESSGNTKWKFCGFEMFQSKSEQ